MHKYPRTQHIEGSRLQPGDEDLDAIPFAEIQDRHVVVEEKMDGANCGISFSPAGELQLQSRGHYLTGGAREKQFNLLKQWATARAGVLWNALGDRYVLYGEWLFGKHTLFYDRLPHYLMEFDILDTRLELFLDTPTRAEMLAEVPLPAVRVLHSGPVKTMQQLEDFVGPSLFMSDEIDLRLPAHARDNGLDAERAVRETDLSGLMEGLYIKVEEDGIVTGRYKFVRAGFLQAVEQSLGHWASRPILPNLLAEGVDLFA